MTETPRKKRNSGDWVMRFALPRDRSVDSFPMPSDSQVYLMTLPPSRMGVLQFSGFTNEKVINRRIEELGNLIASHQLRKIGPPCFARYNAPWYLLFLRRKEVLFPLQVDSAHERQC